MNEKFLTKWSLTIKIVVLVFLGGILYFRFFNKNTGILLTIFLGLIIGIMYVLLDYNFKNAPLSANMNNKLEVKRGFKFKKTQNAIMIIILVCIALSSFVFDLGIPINVNIEKAPLIFIIFYSIKELYEYIIEASQVISESKKELASIEKNENFTN